MSGYLSVCAAMVLDAVDELSDEGSRTKEEPNDGKMPKAKAGPKGKPSKLKNGTDDPSAGSAKSPKKPPKTVLKRPAANDSENTSGPPLKKPAGTGPKPAPEKVSVSKGLYKNGIYGFKVNGTQVLKALR